jgi:hypothetical protein
MGFALRCRVKGTGALTRGFRLHHSCYPITFAGPYSVRNDFLTCGKKVCNPPDKLDDPEDEVDGLCYKTCRELTNGRYPVRYG